MKAPLRKLSHMCIHLLGAAGAMTATRQVSKSNPRILLVHPGHMGAIVMTTPIIRALKQHAPDAHITMLLGPWSAQVASRHADIDQVLTCAFPSPRDNTVQPLQSLRQLFTLAKQLRQGNYDLAINLRPRFWWGAALTYLARIPLRVGYAVEPCKPLITVGVPTEPSAHFTAAYLRLASVGLQALGYKPLEQPYTAERYPLCFVPTQEEQQWATERLSMENIDPASPLVVIHPGTGAPVKLWRPEAWARCANTLIRTPDTRIILTGGKSELPLLQEIAGAMTVQPIVIPNMTLGQLAALLQRASLVLGVDSGPLHLAVAQGTPTIRIFGPTDAATFGPWGSKEQHAVVVSTHRCQTCPAIPCKRLAFQPEELASHPCVRLVTEQEVLATIAKMLPHLLIGKLTGTTI